MRSCRRTSRIVALVAVAALALSACGSDSKDNAAAGSKGKLTIAGSDFVEQDIVANIYAAALEAKGYDVTVKPHLGSRTVLAPALEKGEVDLVAEYLGSYLGYLEEGAPSHDLKTSVVKLRTLLKPKNLTALTPAPGQDANALAVTKATADKYKLVNISDLKAVAGQLKLGGPPDCPTRATCAVGFKGTYGVEFKEFKPLDPGGPITKKALADGDIDVALLFTSDMPEDAVVLNDDKGLQPAENLVPVIRKAKVTDDIKQILNKVSAKLTSGELSELNAKSHASPPPDAADIAKDWAEEYKLL